MTELRVLVIDGSVNVRKRIGDAVKSDSRLSLCGVASTASIASQKLGTERPDIVVLDTDLEMNCTIAFIKEMAVRLPDAQIVLFGTQARRGSPSVLDGMAAGASDYVTKPDANSLKDPAWDCIESQLLPKLQKRADKLASGKRRKLESQNSSEEEVPKVLEREMRKVGDHIRNEVVKVEKNSVPKFKGQPLIVCVGSSTGGPNALADVFAGFPKYYPVPIVVTQHMPPMFTKMLAQRLNGLGTLVFHEGEHGMELEAGHVYIAPGGKHMTVHKTGKGFRIELNEEPPENSCRPAVDVMLRSVARAVGGATLVTILTGMGKDGYLGCRELANLGATVFAQDEETSVVWGMPGYVASAGLADKILPLPEVAAAMNEHVGNGIVGRRI